MWINLTELIKIEVVWKDKVINSQIQWIYTIFGIGRSGKITLTHSNKYGKILIYLSGIYLAFTGIAKRTLYQWGRTWACLFLVTFSTFNVWNLNPIFHKLVLHKHHFESWNNLHLWKNDTSFVKVLYFLGTEKSSTEDIERVTGFVREEEHFVSPGRESSTTELQWRVPLMSLVTFLCNSQSSLSGLKNQMNVFESLCMCSDVVVSSVFFSDSWE